MTFALLLGCFFLSGFSALLYETAWTRQFAFLFGTSELAVVAVLAAYMGGLALGAALAARLAPRVRRPVLIYGLLEGAIALWALMVPFAIGAVRSLYLSWLGGLDALPETLGAAVHAFHLLGAFAVLVPCTALMGATLPLLARHAITRDEQIGPRVAHLYAVNTAGAIAGTLAAAFLLLPAIGLERTVWVGAAVNAAVFAAAAALARSAPSPAREAPRRATGASWVLPAIALSGAVSFTYEVVWFRLLGHLLGGSTAAFSTMLATFLAGIALGSALASRFASGPARAAIGFALAQLATAVAARLGFAAIGALPDWASALDASVNSLAPGALVAASVLLPLTLCVGASFPFAVRILARGPEESATASARVFAWNTTGSIVGAVGAGYVLLPGLGLEGTFGAAVLANLALAAFAGANTPPVRRLALATAAVGALLVFAFPTARPDALLRRSPLGGTHLGEFDYFAVGRSSTVALLDQGAKWRLTTNGLPESLILPPDYPVVPVTARWLSLLPVLARPEIRDMVIIGLGGGLTVGAVPASVESVDVIELEPEVVAANRVARADQPGDPLDDPRVSLRLSDARGALILSERRYDAIVSQPSHPWTSGASHLYTREFFSLARARLGDDGVFVQWIGAHYIDPPRLRSLVAALNEAFAHVELYQPAGAALVMLASDAPFDIVESATRALAAAPEGYLAEGIRCVEAVASGLVLDAAGSRAFGEGARPNSDDFNTLATKGRPSGAADEWIGALFTPYDPLPAIASRLDPSLIARRLRASGQGERVRRLAAGLDPARGALALGWLEVEAERPGHARRHFASALERDPDSRDAALGLALTGGTRETRDALPARIRGLLEARDRARSGEEMPSDLDPLLAAWKPDELPYPEAVEMRVRLRVRRAGPGDLDEALQLLRPLIHHRTRARHLVLYAMIARRQRNEEDAWMALDALVDNALAQASPAVVSGALALAESLGDPPSPHLAATLRRASERKPRRRRAPNTLLEAARG